MKPTSPIGAWLVSLVCPPEDRAEVLADLAEAADARAGRDGPLRARLSYCGRS